MADKLTWRASSTASGNLTEADAPSKDAMGGQPGKFVIKIEGSLMILRLNDEIALQMPHYPDILADQIYFMKRYAETFL